MAASSVGHIVMVSILIEAHAFVNQQAKVKSCSKFVT